MKGFLVFKTDVAMTPGTYSLTHEVLPCPLGHYCPNTHMLYQPFPCPPG